MLFPSGRIGKPFGARELLRETGSTVRRDLRARPSAG